MWTLNEELFRVSLVQNFEPLGDGSANDDWLFVRIVIHGVIRAGVSVVVVGVVSRLGTGGKDRC